MSVDKIKVSELFFSLQGEGQYIGVPSIFLRTFGCNFSCQGFGMPEGVLSTEAEEVAERANEFNSYEQLPLVRTGCDSYASWHHKFKDLSPMLTVDAIVSRMKELVPDCTFSKDKHLIITGGEPLLGWQRSYPALLDAISENGMSLSKLTFETNGTQTISDRFFDYLFRSATGSNLEVTFSISAKLPCSGEKWEDAIKPDVVKQYLMIPKHKSYFKFVVANEKDVQDAERAVAEYRAAGVNIPVYLMPVGGTNDVYTLNNKQVADIAMQRGYRYSPRLQVDLFRNAWGT